MNLWYQSRLKNEKYQSTLPTLCMGFWIFHLAAERIISNFSCLGDKLAATELRMSQLCQHSSDALWTIAGKVCVHLIYALEILGSFLQFTYCNQEYKWKTAGPAMFWTTKMLLVILQPWVNPGDVKIEIQNNASLSSFSPQGKPDSDRGLRVVIHPFQFGFSRFTGEIMF